MPDPSWGCITDTVILTLDETRATPKTRHPLVRAPWLALVLALAWVILLRIPIVWNAHAHLDSDLAVDGLTLVELTRGQVRWHYPGTPHMGILPAFLSLPQALAFGTNPVTLVSGGLVAYLLVMISTFLLAHRLFGRSVALWALLPLTFASPGLVWLSGRITGGHLLTVAWQAVAFLLFGMLAGRGRWQIAGALGLWCGLGLYLDRLFIYSLFGILPGLVSLLFEPGRFRSRLLQSFCFAAGLALGHLPAPLGEHFEPHDAYRSQFDTIFVDPLRQRVNWNQAATLLEEHARILFFECLPRLFTGHRLPGFQADPSPAMLQSAVRRPDPPDPHPIVLGTVAVAGSITLLGIWGVLAAGPRTPQPHDAARDAESLVRMGLVVTCVLTLCGFLVNRNIFNSDNYRYLVPLIVPWSIGVGLAMSHLVHSGAQGRVLALGLALALAVLGTLDTVRWYGRFGWTNHLGVPTRVPLEDPVVEWLDRHPEIDSIFGGYWDVYRIAFLCGGRVRGVPFREYPDRFPEWSRGLPGDRPRTLVARSDGRGPFYRNLALREGGRILAEFPGGTSIIDWP